MSNEGEITMILRKKFTFVILWIMLLSIFGSAVHAQAKTYGGKGSNYKFYSDATLKKGTYKYYLGKNCDSNSIEAIKKSLKTWNSCSTEIKFKYKAAKKKFATEDKINTIGTKFSTKSMLKHFGSNTAIAANIFHISGVHIVESDIVLSDAYDYCNGQNRYAYDYQGVFTHELGHTFGLRDLYFGDKQLSVSSEIDLPTMYGEAYYKHHSYSVFTFIRSLSSGDKKGIRQIEKFN